jgi:hypothetical protein
VEVAVGFMTHSGWAIAVVVGLVDGHIKVYDRRRVALVAPDLPRQPYHAVADLPAGEARQFVAAVDASIADRSLTELSAIRDAVSDHRLVAVGVVGHSREIPDVATVLASHALMHASEGEQYRRGVSGAAEQLCLPVWRTESRQLTTEVAQAMGWSSSRLADEHAQVRTAIGPPWQKDHKEAAAAALISLHSAR